MRWLRWLLRLDPLSGKAFVLFVTGAISAVLGIVGVAVGATQCAGYAFALWVAFGASLAVLGGTVMVVLAP